MKSDKEDPLDVTLLELLQRGHTLIAQVLKLSNEIPFCFRYDYKEQSEPVASLHSNNKQDVQSNGSNVVNFMSYLNLGITKMKSKATKNVLRRPFSSYSDYHDESRVENHSIIPSPSSENNRMDEDFTSVLIDFAYLGAPETYDNHEHVLKAYCDLHHINTLADIPEATRRRIISKQEELEQKLVSQYEETIQSFAKFFSSVYVYYMDMNKLWIDMINGRYILHSVQSIMMEQGLRPQFFCELLYLLGNVLLLIELYIPGTIRERFIIAHHRYCRNTSTPTNAPLATSAFFDGLCKAFQTCKMDPTTVIPTDYMNRLSIEPSFVQFVIDCLMDHEIYSSWTNAFPSIQHRSVRLSKQAQMMAVIVHFQPGILASDRIYCRHIVDRFFLDSWRIPLYNGFIIDMLDEWNDRYPSAKLAIHEVLHQDRLRHIVTERNEVAITCLRSLDKYISQKSFSLEFILDQMDDILQLLRDANDILKWQMLHKAYSLRETSQNSTALVDDLTVVNMIFSTSRLDELVKCALKEIFPLRESKFNDFQSTAAESMKKLSTLFFGNINLSTVDKNHDIGVWFRDIGKEVEGQLCWNSPNQIQYFMEALSDMTKIDVIDKNDYSRNIMKNAESCLRRMAKLQCIPHDICAIVDTISDFSVCRGAMEYYIPIFHMKVKTNPHITSLLSPFFVKATSFLNSTVVQGISPNDASATFVRDLHSNALVSYVKKVLDVIPISVFSSRLFERNDNCLVPLPNKIEIDSLVHYAHFDERLQLAALTYELSTLTRGINDMEDTSVGDIKLEPQKLLEEGLRKELGRRISYTLHFSLQFGLELDRSFKSHSLFRDRCRIIFSNVTRNLDAMQRAMLWIQDFINVRGIEVYHEEYQKIISYNAAIDTGAATSSMFLRSDELTPIPSLAKSTDDLNSYTFLGRTINALVKLVDHKFCVYSRLYNSWFLLNGETVCDMRTIRSLRDALDISGLIGMIQVLEFQITNELKSMYKFYGNATPTYGAILENFRDDISPEWRFHEKGLALYDATILRILKLIVPLQTLILRIGQLQLLRKMISDEVLISTRLESLEYNRLMMEEDRKGVSSHFYHFHKVFTQPNALEGLPSLLVLYIVSILSNSIYDEDLDVIRGMSDTSSVDGGSIVIGIVTLLSQFHPIYAKTTISFLRQYIWIYEKEMWMDDIVLTETIDKDPVSRNHTNMKSLLNINKGGKRASSNVCTTQVLAMKFLDELNIMCKDV